MEKLFKSDFDIIVDQFQNIYRDGEKIKEIDYVNYQQYCDRIDRKGNKYYEIGIRLDKITTETYRDVLKEALDNHKYSVLLRGNSIVSLYYQFDEEKKLKYCSLSYVPNCEEKGVINNNYIRIDYEIEGNALYIHPLSHIHITTHKNNIRLPLDHIVTPNEFMYIILVYIIQIKDDNIKKLHLNEKISCVVLSKEENKKLRISFGE